MKGKRRPAEQIVETLQRAENGVAAADLISELGITEAMFRRWRKQYSGLNSGQIRELDLLVGENSRLRKRIVELSVEKSLYAAAFQDVQHDRNGASLH